MNSRTTRSFSAAFRSLWRETSNLPGLRFKRIGDDVSVRIGRDYRALGILEGDTVYWHWIGKHDEYDRLVG
jgi:hypothetical protein